MDRWVSIAMAANSPPINVFSHFTSRYAVCLAILYFCGSVMVLDITLQDCWKVGYMLSEQKLSTLTDAILVTQDWERLGSPSLFFNSNFVLANTLQASPTHLFEGSAETWRPNGGHFRCFILPHLGVSE
jgi:hypothetical protein